MKIKKYKLSAIVFCSVIIALALVLPNMAFATPVPDTGQTLCYGDGYTSVGPECTRQPGEPFYGQDAQYGTNTHSYTDLGNGVVRDNVTGLEWQQATAPGYKTWEQAIDYCNNLSLGGKDDWRLPTVKELSTLVDSSIPAPGPTINTTYFPGTQGPSNYWASTTSAFYPFFAWYVDFGSGGVGDLNINEPTADSVRVRAVRGEQSNNNFIDNGDGTITDKSTGLMWQQATTINNSWEQALAYCENLILPAGGYSDWRLPNRNELQTIVDYSRYSPAIDTTFFPDTVASEYWSSTTNAKNYPDFAWVVLFNEGGSVSNRNKPAWASVRAVRNDVSLPTTTTTTTTPISTTTTTIPSGPCAAEAIYGENSVQTELLREYRDNVLSKTPQGQETIKTYYKLSPTVTKLFEQMPLLKNRAKAFIDSMLPGIRKKVEESQGR